jgi:hypothetical protein
MAPTVELARMISQLTSQLDPIASVAWGLRRANYNHITAGTDDPGACGRVGALQSPVSKDADWALTDLPRGAQTQK